MRIRPDDCTCTFGAAWMQKQLDAILVEVPGVQSAADLECIHRMRVASRRLRAGQAYFNNCLPGGIVPEWEAQIRAVTRSLGQARDLDIQMQTLRRFQILREAQEYLPGLESLLQILSGQREQAQQAVQSAAAALGVSQVIAEARGLLTQRIAAGEDGEPSTPLKLLAERAIRSRLSRFLSYESYIHDPKCILELHAMRIAAKRLRYTLEIFSPLDKSGFKSWLKGIRLVQELLGLIHDCDVWAEYLPQFLHGGGEADTPNPDVSGIELFFLNRANTRHRLYREFIHEWDLSQEKRTWQRLASHLEKSSPVERISVVTLINTEISQEVSNEDRHS